MRKFCGGIHTRHLYHLLIIWPYSFREEDFTSFSQLNDRGNYPVAECDEIVILCRGSLQNQHRKAWLQLAQ